MMIKHPFERLVLRTDIYHDAAVIVDERGFEVINVDACPIYPQWEEKFGIKHWSLDQRAYMNLSQEQAAANAARIVKCVNACAGMEYPAAEIDELKRQRDELLGLVKAVVYHSLSVTVNGTRCAAFPWVEYEAIVNKAKGGEK